MLVSQLIRVLQNTMKEVGNKEVLITDGHRNFHYRGKYSVGIFEDIDGKSYIDIGIGNCLESDDQGS